MGLITAAELNGFVGEMVDVDLAEVLITDVTAEAQQATGQTIEQVASDAVSLRGVPGRRLALPQRPVTAVASVALVDGDVTTALTVATDYRLVADDLVREGTNPWATGSGWGGWDQTVDVTYTHGWAVADIPAWIKAIALSACARAVERVGVDGTPLDVYGGGGDRPVVQESVGAYSVTYASGGTDAATLSGGLLTDGEVRRLRGGLARGTRSVLVG